MENIKKQGENPTGEQKTCPLCGTINYLGLDYRGEERTKNKCNGCYNELK